MTTFEINVDGQDYPVELQQFGYSYRIMVLVNEVPVCFEPDEERNFRAIVPPEQMQQVDAALLQRILHSLETALR